MTDNVSGQFYGAENEKAPHTAFVHRGRHNQQI